MFDTERIALRAWRKAISECGYEISESTLVESIGRDGKDTQILFQKALGENFDFQQARKLRLKYTQGYIRQHGVPIKDGLFQVLDLLEAYSMPKAVATSTETSRAKTVLTASNLIDRFDVLTCGDEVSNGKPEPDIFLLTAERLKISPEECIVLEDSESGIQAAFKAQMTPILVPDIKSPSKETIAAAHKFFSNLQEVASYLSKVLETKTH